MKIVDRCDALVRVFVAVAAGALLVSAIAGPAAADGNNSNKPVLTFNGGIGVIPVSSVSCVPSATPCVTGSTVTVTVNQNVVRSQTPAGQIWVINQLNAQVSANGSITVYGKGLVLGGGNNAGGIPTTTPPLAVFATLSCSSSPNFALSTTTLTGVAVSPNGDFQINDMLTPTPTFPCASPLLLIQSASNSHWFALGIVSSGNSGH
jgi:hypothetical protein